MVDLMREKWTALHGNLLFEIAVSSCVDQTLTSSIKISFKDNNKDVFIVNLYNDRIEVIDAHFVAGGYVRGTLQYKINSSPLGYVQLALFADIHFGYAGKYDDQHFEGVMAIFEVADITPIDPIPIDPIILPDIPGCSAETPIVENADGDLFPYVYIRPWPSVSATEQSLCFICYKEPASSPPANSFYDQLCALKVQHNRTAMQQLAVSFLEGLPPFQGQFIGDISQDGIYINSLFSSDAC